MPMTGLSNPNPRLVNLGVALTQQYGVALHLTREALYKALRPEAHPRFDTIQKVCKALGIKLTATSA
jgi:probable addiction module antidote protein